MAQYKTKRYIDALPTLIKSINDRYLDSIGMSPSQVTVENSIEVFQRRYNKILELNPKYAERRFKIGDEVRVELKKKIFDKAYTENYQNEIFIVKKIIYRPPIYVYNLDDRLGEPLDKSYTAEQMVRAFHSVE